MSSFWRGSAPKANPRCTVKPDLGTRRLMAPKGEQAETSAVTHASARALNLDIRLFWGRFSSLSTFESPFWFTPAGFWERQARACYASLAQPKNAGGTDAFTAHTPPLHPDFRCTGGCLGAGPDA